MSRASDEDLAASAAYRSEKQGAGKTKKGGLPKRGGGKVNVGGKALSGFNRKTGQRNRRYPCDGEYHLTPRCPWRDTPRGDGSSFPQGRDRAHKHSYSSTSIETPVLPQKAESVGDGETGSRREQSSVATVDAGDLFMVSQDDSVVALETGATANLACFSWLANHNRILERRANHNRIFDHMSLQNEISVWGWALWGGTPGGR